MRMVWRLLLLLAAIVLIVFAVSNRADVALTLWPLPVAVELPVYAVVIGGLIVGFVLGEIAAWLAHRRWRRDLRQSERRVAALEREIAALRQRDPALTGPPAIPISRE